MAELIVGPITDPRHRTEIANGQRFAARFAGRVKYAFKWNRWLVWSGTRWIVDDGALVQPMAKQVGKQVWDQVKDALPHIDTRAEAHELLSFARATASDRGIEHLLSLARSEPDVPIDIDRLDSRPWLLTVENGTLNLQTGKLASHHREDYLTKLSPVVYQPDAACPRWEQFLQEIMAGDLEAIDFLRRLTGYWLTGLTRDHVLPVFYGHGANGKSVFLNTILALLGPDYACKSPASLLLASAHEQHPTGLADLHGKRLVACIEADAGRRLNEALVKELTGGDSIRARRMREDFWQFEPTHKLVLATNHRPTVRGTDHAIWRRLRLVPFSVTIPDHQQDRELPDKLRDELSGILNWALAGCAEWQANGLCEPASITTATAHYRAEQDVLADWINGCCVVEAGAVTPSGELYKSYTAWAEANGDHTVSPSVFGRLLTEREFEPCNGAKKIRLRKGLRLND